MKTDGKQRRKKDMASLKSNTTISISSSRGKTSARTGSRKCKSAHEMCHLSGKNETVLAGKDEHLVSSKATQALGQPSLDRVGISGTANNVPELAQTLKPSMKIKLQLFPIDECTRLGLEKDGYNPHLELTLKAQKKIHSVVKHLNMKWGSSSIAVGELMLFPYSICMENLGVYKRWSLKDIDTSAADVYTVIGKPSIFRLRYGWFSNSEPENFRLPLTSSGFEDYLQSEGIQRGFSNNAKTMEGEKQGCEDGLRTSQGVTLSSLAWDDCLTNISIGGLLSEASLQANAKCYDPVPVGNDLCLQQVPFSSDSFDVAISNLIRGRAQGPRLSSNGSHSSILDAEETCHAFPFQKLSSPGENVLPASRSAPAGSCNQDANFKSFKSSNLFKVGSQSETGLELDPQAPKNDLLPQTQGVNNLESSLGLADIKWTDSLGPLDLGLSSSQQINSGESISLNGFFGSSLDAFQSCSFFARDGKVPPT
ncbi:TSL-kinase interacting protein 1-like [Macadamia integrifolia]|uniref:TSL-kinase interacting protein 1-like n=1 Tax=Macadamia integrifolia TaxID=60698 RepID=UPI001C4F3787|nr:TSL-kinase interacting protein 1-like [Macadamia integrifolia]XP_042513481.1 TSL-kinase interacting protein 1-like [Macadamia integrifolia]XP_042513490.1 TSL-kinase interacting protein 1-like [Macadamia integrifolia]XP_042513497.1 TSL-kinase interacting protein 1-like [Macadamia integrifolia]XP_042513505.1 TSL-kinase interacting protein 1-like [Macadamia integrifolia]